MLPPEKMAEIGHVMCQALAAAIAASPNDNVAVHRALWDKKMARIAELEAALEEMRGAGYAMSRARNGNVQTMCVPIAEWTNAMRVIDPR